MRNHDQVHAEIPGQDSFLDVIANLVGVILIMIMVAAMQAKNAYMAVNTPIEEQGPCEPSPLAQNLAAAEAASRAVEKDFNNITDKIAREQFEIDYRRHERDRMQTLIVAAEQTLNAKRDELTDAQRAEYDVFTQLNLARRELRDLKLAKDATENSPPTPGIIEHLPTPMAKTVFGKELHLRLLNGKICFVPLNELVDQFKADAQKNLWKLKDTDTITEVLGPIDGFRMKYTLRKAERSLHTQAGTARAQYVELQGFILVPMSDDLGEPLEMALAQGSATRSLLRDYPPDRTTVTVWVYPDSFPDFRKLKAEMFKLGYATAGRPLPEGHPIGGSPDGSQSAAQ